MTQVEFPNTAEMGYRIEIKLIYKSNISYIPRFWVCKKYCKYIRSGTNTKKETELSVCQRAWAQWERRQKAVIWLHGISHA